MKVNMTPNPLDVVTIHASQGDTEARQWEFELHNNGELIDTSEVTEQLFFKAYKGGTEQLLPENTSTPTTSPFLGDIRYPQGLLSDQEFTYRQSPTEEDGLAKITDIKGNTLVWNQLVSSASGWASNNGTLSQSGNTYTYTVTALGNSDYENRMQRPFPFVIPKGHKILVSCEFYYPRNTQVAIWLIRYSGLSNRAIRGTALANQWTNISGIIEDTTAEFGYYQLALNTIASTGFSVGDSVQVRNPMAIDLTMLFGEGNEPATVEEFTSLFPLSYYSYNQGSLLSFMGNGIKTVGKNIYSLEAENVTAAGITLVNNGDGTYRLYGTASAQQDFRIRPEGGSLPLEKGTYLFSGIQNGRASTYRFYASYHEDGVSAKYVSIENGTGSFTLTDKGVCILFVRVYAGATIDITVKPMLTFDYVTDQTFEPYTSSTLSLPISTYFPNGMKSAGNVYDELTPRKAITRIGAVDLGSLEWERRTSLISGVTIYRFTTNVDDLKLAPVRTVQMICKLYRTITDGSSVQIAWDKVIYNNGNSTMIFISDNDYTDAAAFKTAMNGVMLYYELATPTETSFTTASLVTENAEIPLSNNDGVLIGKCTEQLSENPGFFDAKIKLADGDGECYSNKLQLHVERSPQ